MKRPRIFVACSYDRDAQTGIIVVELRGQPSRFWEKVVHRAPGPEALIEFGLAVARLERLRDFDLFQPERGHPRAVDEALGDVRLRWVARRSNVGARERARGRLRELAPRPVEEEGGCSLADLGVDLEIAARVAASSP